MLYDMMPSMEEYHIIAWFQYVREVFHVHYANNNIFHTYHLKYSEYLYVFMCVGEGIIDDEIKIWCLVFITFCFIFIWFV